MNFNKDHFLSNYHPCSITLNNKEYSSLDELYREYKDDPYPYKDLDTAMLFGTFKKFLGNPGLKEKLLLTSKEDIGTIRSKKLRERLLFVRRFIIENKI